MCRIGSETIIASHLAVDLEFFTGNFVPRSKLKKRLAKRRRRARDRRNRFVLHPVPEENENEIEIRLTVHLAPEAFARAAETMRDVNRAIAHFAPMVAELLGQQMLQG